MNTFNLTEIRAGFPIVEQYTFVNHAALSPISRTVQNAIIEQATLQTWDTSQCGGIGLARYEHGRRLAADLVGASPERVAWIDNTSHGLSHVANGLDWRHGDNIVLPALEFPSNYLAWAALQKKGVELRLVDAVDGRISAEMIAPISTHGPA